MKNWLERVLPEKLPKFKKVFGCKTKDLIEGYNEARQEDIDTLSTKVIPIEARLSVEEIENEISKTYNVAWLRAYLDCDKTINIEKFIQDLSQAIYDKETEKIAKFKEGE